MQIRKKKKNLTKNLLENSLLLDRDILGSLANIFLSGLINFSPNSEINENDLTEKMNSFLTSKNDSIDPNEKIDEYQKLNKKLKDVILIFEKVNRERKIFREIIMEMLKKKFWKIKKEEECELFINRLEGLNLEILKTKINKYENEKINFTKLDNEKDLKIQKLYEINDKLTKEAQKDKDDLKKFLLNETKPKKATKIHKLTRRNSSTINLLDTSKINIKPIRRGLMGGLNLRNSNKKDMSFSKRPNTGYSSRNTSSRKFNNVKSRGQSPGKGKDFSRTKTFANNKQKDFNYYEEYMGDYS